jgi:uncharacterized membrane protein YhhN
MRVHRSALPWAYVAVATADLALTASRRRRAGRWRALTKPLLMPTLAWWVRTRRRHAHDAMVRRTLVALGLCTAGDVALLRDDDAAFLGALTAFLGAHGAYASAFGSSRGASLRSAAAARRLAPVATAWAVVVPALARRAGALRVPVLVYGSALAGMQATALLLDPGVPRSARRRIAGGAACFMLSDALIGLRRFVAPARTHRGLDVAVMATYATAQWLIADGVVRARPQRA